MQSTRKMHLFPRCESNLNVTTNSSYTALYLIKYEIGIINPDFCLRNPSFDLAKYYD